MISDYNLNLTYYKAKQKKVPNVITRRNQKMNWAIYSKVVETYSTKYLSTCICDTVIKEYR